MNARLTKSFALNGPLLAAALLSLLAAAPAEAQQRQEEGERSRARIVTIGAGVQAYPKYPGADELGINPMPILGLRREGDPITFEAPDEGWGFGLLGRDSFINIGPAIQFQGRRREEDVGADVGNVGFTVEAGAFVEAFLGESFRLRAEGRRGFGGHEGVVGDLGADFIARSGDTTIFSIGPRLRLADEEYMATYFGVSPQAAAQTGLPVYAPGGGVYAVGATAGLRFDLGGGIGVHSYARYDRLTGDAADSPIVTGFGSRNQYGAGVGLSYSFRMRGSRRR